MEGVRANQFTYGSVLRACTSVSCMNLGKQIQGCIQKSRFVDNLYVQSALVDFNAKCGEMEDAFCVFESMEERDLVSWNVMISGYAFRGYNIDAFLLFRWMFRQGILPDCFTLGSVLKASVGGGKCGGLVKISMIHGCIIRLGYGSYSIISGALVDAYVKCGNLVNANYIYKKMQNKDRISCTALITGYAREGKNSSECLELFCQLRRNHREIDSIILCSMINICSNTASLSLGRQLHAIAIKYQSSLDVAMSNALVDMYAKTGEIEDANNVFHHMTEKNVISWTSMISAYGVHGRGIDAVSYFKKMECEGFEPNDITFLSLLFACSHNGLTAEGWECFSKMVKKYKIVPRDEHYSCLVDIFARSGCLNESYDLICRTNIRPSASLWGSVLGACSIYGNMDLGKVAARHLCNIETTNAVSYVVLAGLYSAAGLWDSAWNARNVVQTRRLPKDPGYSLSHSGNDMVKADLTEGSAKLVDAIGDDSDVVICATDFQPSWNLLAPWKVDNFGTVNLVDACQKLGINRFILISSILVNGAAMGQLFNPVYIILNVMGLILVAKLQAERYIRKSGINYTIIRPGGLKTILHKEIMQPEDTLFRGSISRDQVAEVAVEALLHPESHYKVVEIVASTDAPKRSFQELFGSIEQQ